MDRPIERKKPVRAFAAAATVIAAAAVFGYSQLGRDGRSYRIEASRLTLATVERGEFRDVTPIYGIAMPLRTVYLDTVEGGTVEAIHVREGAMLRAGDPILKFRNTAFELQVFSQEARISEQLDINANMRLALERNRLEHLTRLNDIDLSIRQFQRRLEQAEQLVGEGAISASDLQDMRDSYAHALKDREILEQAQKRDEAFRVTKIAQLSESEKRLQAHLQAVRESLEQLVVRAPVAGQLTSLTVEIGESRQRGERLGQIDVVDGYKIVADVDSFYLPRVHKGQKAQYEANGKRYVLAVDKIYPEVKDGKFRVDFRFEGDAPANLLRGQNISFQLQMGEPRQSLVLRNGGFYQDTAGRWAFVVSEGGAVAEKRNIRLGRRSPGQIEVLGGLEAGDQVVVSSYSGYADVDRLILN